ncbi:MAG: hypothetical protein AAGK78_04295 [Planctomycetota bacterium]
MHHLSIDLRQQVLHHASIVGKAGTVYEKVFGRVERQPQRFFEALEKSEMLNGLCDFLFGERRVGSGGQIELRLVPQRG